MVVVIIVVVDSRMHDVKWCVFAKRKRCFDERWRLVDAEIEALFNFNLYIVQSIGEFNRNNVLRIGNEDLRESVVEWSGRLLRASLTEEEG